LAGLGPALVSVGVFSGHFFPRWAARLHVGLLLALSDRGPERLPPPTPARERGLRAGIRAVGGRIEKAVS